MPPAQGPLSARRILVYGVTGSGKSTAAKRIANILALPCILADELAWEPGWISVPDDEQRRRIAAVVAEDAWVLDTAYGKWLDLPLRRAELIVGLDYPRWLSLSRLIRRTVSRLITKESVCNGNVERLRIVLSRKSLILWHFQSFKRKQERMRAWAAAPGAPPVLLFKHPRELDHWLAGLAAKPATVLATRPSG
jgi:adenylate kinase family enzyme